MIKEPTLEERVAKARSQAPIIVEVDGQKYEAARAQLATLDKISALISHTPKVDNKTANMITEALSLGGDARIQADALATLIIGGKVLDGKNEPRQLPPITKTVTERRFFGLIKTTREVQEDVVEWVDGKALFEELRDKFYYASPAEVCYAIAKIIADGMETSFFLHTMISLHDANILRQTKTTLRGQ
jgi:hypothetical protein